MYGAAILFLGHPYIESATALSNTHQLYVICTINADNANNIINRDANMHDSISACMHICNICRVISATGVPDSI